MQPDPVEDSSDQADVYLDVAGIAGSDIAGIHGLLEVPGEGGEVVGVAALDEARAETQSAGVGAGRR